MPFYNLKCVKCGCEFEKYAEISMRDSIECPECSSKELETIFGEKSAAVIVKSGAKENTCPNAHICGGCCHH